jgi:hypothetical protein
LWLPDQYPDDWVVDCKSVGNGEKALIYLGRYLYRGVIQEKDIISIQDGKVTFRYTESKTRKTRFRTVPGATFLWLLMRHVLPKGFRRARHFGFLHPNSKRLIQLLHYHLNINPSTPQGEIRRPQFTCPCCGGPMTITRTGIYPRPKSKLKPGVMEPLVM